MDIKLLATVFASREGPELRGGVGFIAIGAWTLWRA
jgi:hypothetical protein